MRHLQPSVPASLTPWTESSFPAIPRRRGPVVRARVRVDGATAVVNPGRVVSPVRPAGHRRVQTLLNTKGGPSAWLTRVGPARQTGACRWQDWYESPARPGHGALRCTPCPGPRPPRLPSYWFIDIIERLDRRYV